MTSMTNTAPERSREEWARRTYDARRKARFTFLLRGARKIIDGEPRLTPDELRQLAGIYGAAADHRAAS